MASDLTFRMLQVPLFTFLLSLCLVFPTVQGWRNITDIENAYKGIYWWTALVECSDEHFDILVESTRMMSAKIISQGSIRLDIAAPLSKVEGAEWSNILAWYGQSLPNVGVKYNADNYAWFWTNNWFNEKWGWKDNGLDPRWSPENTTKPGGPHDMAGPGLGFLMPKENQTNEQKNCHAGNDPREVFCDYLGEPYSEWLKDHEKPFTSEGGCELTKQCWNSFSEFAIDPSCVCKCDGERTPLSDPECAGFRGGPPGSHSYA
ncbi:hypothetical protein BDV27DRAFT_140894 [Aspergillus caelatus]|uniref:C-type lectin domain-containing protein n=1 Tax=Aspergillus caelatus TaxID=61420 RepID=A0A5N7ALX8_9EURO|nr:uncharacterized protein BDV27DRAFT_140894 [Aspergillus caelatus]KAE8369999.1 hypothetical protein BDV27DRAFT_140894 [Aspergillus caelatus]